MFRPALTLTLAACLCPSFAVATDVNKQSLEESFKDVIRPYLKNYCLDCHGSDEPEAMLDLSNFSSAADVSKAHQTWAILLERIEADEMPPKDADPQPTTEQAKAVADWIRNARKLEAARNAGDPGIVLARRLSNAEYNYTIRDLTGADIRPTDTFPVDSANEAGFDNSGESLTMSPALLNKYLGAARQVTDHLVLLPNGIAFAPHPVVTDTDRDKYCVKRIVDFYKQQPVDYADYFFTAWKYRHCKAYEQPGQTFAAIAKAESVSPKYLQTVWEFLTESQPAVGPVKTLQTMWNKLPSQHEEHKAARTRCEEMRNFVVQLRSKLVPEVDKTGVKELHQGSQTLVLWRNRQRAANRRSCNSERLIESTPDISDVDQDLLIPESPEERNRHIAAFEQFCNVFPDAFFVSERGRDYVKKSSKQQGEKGRLLSAGFHSMMGYFRDDQPLYDLILNDAQQQEIDSLWQQLDFITSAPNRQYVGFLWFERTDSRYMRDPKFDFARAEDRDAQSATMIKRLAAVYSQKARNNGGKDVALKAIERFFEDINSQIRWVENARLSAEASQITATIDFAESAYRRPLLPTEREELSAFYKQLRDVEKLNHEEAIQDMMVSVLMSPHVCYRIDMGQSHETLRPLTDYELASRLSYFLWSSMPDAELLQAAKAGTLHQPEALIAQTRRMIQDKRIRGLAVEFATNWLDIRRFEEHNSVDRERFPEFNNELRQAMFEEPVRFFIDLLQQNAAVTQLLDAEHTFVNADLAKHYGVDSLDFGEQEWVRLNNATKHGRGGLVPMSVFLTKNAPGLRTSPVKRGYWVVRRLLGERIPPPPPNVAELPDDESKLGDLTLREALAKHREHASCAGCHKRIDSIGLVFEGFGPVGEVRQLDLAGRPVDSTAVLPNGKMAAGVADLQRYLTEDRQNEFIDNLCRKLLSYSLGRGLILSDDLLIQDMTDRLQTTDNKFRTLIETIVTSPQFLNKRGM